MGKQKRSKEKGKNLLFLPLDYFFGLFRHYPVKISTKVKIKNR